MNKWSDCRRLANRIAIVWRLSDLYENIPMQYTAIFHGCKNDNFQLKCFDFFHFFAQNIDCGYTLEPPQ